jgi:hypothetical protein
MFFFIPLNPQIVRAHESQDGPVGKLCGEDAALRPVEGDGVDFGFDAAFAAWLCVRTALVRWAVWGGGH